MKIEIKGTIREVTRLPKEDYFILHVQIHEQLPNELGNSPMFFPILANRNKEFEIGCIELVHLEDRIVSIETSLQSSVGNVRLHAIDIKD